MHLNEIINRFQNAKLIGENSYQCICPAHLDKKASLTITADGNKILMHCHAGCNLNSILTSVGLTEKDLFNNEQEFEKPVIEKEYLYTKEDGTPCFKVVRMRPKNFFQNRYKDGQWLKTMNGAEYVLYNLPNVAKSEVVYFVEGEKDADNLNNIGLVATTSVGGANGFLSKASTYVKQLEGKIVYIIPDNDEPGKKYAENIYKKIKDSAKEVKILDLTNAIPNLKSKGDISDILEMYGKDKTLEIINELSNRLKENDDKNKKNKEEMFDEVFSDENLNNLYELEKNNPIEFKDAYLKIKKICNDNKITGFSKVYKIFKDAKNAEEMKNIAIENKAGLGLSFPGMENDCKKYNIQSYYIDKDNSVYRMTNNGEVLVSYSPIVPIEIYDNINTGVRKVKIAYIDKGNWNYAVVDYSTLMNNQSLAKLSEIGVNVSTENARELVKFFSEFLHLNEDLIPRKNFVSKLGWLNENELIPYSGSVNYYGDNVFDDINKKFGTSGTLEEWVNFFRERRKFNPVSRVIMAASVASILLNKILQNGFDLHIWGESEFGKTVACMVGESIFGNPEQNSNGIGVNFNFTINGLESVLDKYNNIPLFINEMQHQKDLKDYDKILFLISEGKGKTRSTKNIGLAKQNSWNNIVITNGEKSIIKDNSNAGAYNRCISYEITNYSFEKLNEVADFVKTHYGTPIREILSHLNEFDLKYIYNQNLEKLKNKDITNKQKILQAIILTGDKILTDILFKDSYYLDLEVFEKCEVKKKQVVVEERAFEFIRDWYYSQRRHFLSDKKVPEYDSLDLKVDIYGKEMKEGYVAFIPTILKEILNNNGFDSGEILSAWKRKNYLRTSNNRNTFNVRFDSEIVKCIVLDFKKDIEDLMMDEEEDILPF